MAQRRKSFVGAGRARKLDKHRFGGEDGESWYRDDERKRPLARLYRRAGQGELTHHTVVPSTNVHLYHLWKRAVAA